MHHFKAFDMINLQYEIKVWKKILNKATNDKNQHPPPLFSTLRLFLILFVYTLDKQLDNKYVPQPFSLFISTWIANMVLISNYISGQPNILVSHFKSNNPKIAQEKTTRLLGLSTYRGVITKILQVRQSQWVVVICPSPQLVEIGLTYLKFQIRQLPCLPYH